MRLGTLAALPDVAAMHHYAQLGFEFIELCPPPGPFHHHTLPLRQDLPPLPLIWQLPRDLPLELDTYPAITEGIMATCQAQAAAAHSLGAVLLVLQFRLPPSLDQKARLIDHYIAFLEPLTADCRTKGLQVVLRMGPDNREQLNILRDIIRQVPGLAFALDMAYAHIGVVKNLSPEYIWDSDLGPRLGHVYVSDTDGQHPHLRLPLGSLGKMAPEWPKLVKVLKERYNASVTIDVGQASADYLALSRQKWLDWW